MKLTDEQQELIDFAYRINRPMGGNLSILLQYGVICPIRRYDYMLLLEHLRTNQNFGLVTGFEHNHQKQFIWLDTLTEPLKEALRSNGKIKWSFKS
jgi:hypothetical protein